MESFTIEKREDKKVEQPAPITPAEKSIESIASEPVQKEKFREGTRIDLGEDLIAQSGASVVIPTTNAFQMDPIQVVEEPKNTAIREDRSLEGWLSKASILKNENFLDDAKKLYRKIIFHYGDNSEARNALEEIQGIELKEMMSADSPTKLIARSHLENIENSERIREKLEHDLRIEQKTEFLTEKEMTEYQSYVLSLVLKSAPKERIDLGIAFYEMGLFQIAQAIFETVVRYEEFKIEGTYLLALALIANGQAIQATLRIEPLVRDLMISEQKKTDLLYLMGAAFESLNDLKKAREFYRRVYHLNQKYRDVAEKIR